MRRALHIEGVGAGEREGEGESVGVKVRARECLTCTKAAIDGSPSIGVISRKRMRSSTIWE
jgi:hypothetical protein